MVGILGTLVVTQALAPSNEMGNIALAQDAGGADYMMGLMGPLVQNTYVPIVLVDTRQQTMMLYEYNRAQRNFQFLQSRSFRHDRMVEDREMRGANVEAVRNFVERQGR